MVCLKFCKDCLKKNIKIATKSWVLRPSHNNFTFFQIISKNVNDFLKSLMCLLVSLVDLEKKFLATKTDLGPIFFKLMVVPAVMSSFF